MAKDIIDDLVTVCGHEVDSVPNMSHQILPNCVVVGKLEIYPVLGVGYRIALNNIAIRIMKEKRMSATFWSELNNTFDRVVRDPVTVTLKQYDPI